MNNYTQAIQQIKVAILKSRYKAASQANAEMLSLYYGIGEFVSKNTRNQAKVLLELFQNVCNRNCPV